MNIDELKAMHRSLWEFRREISPYWPTPNREDSLAFAFTEAGEVVDAQLRENSTYKRNNDKEHTVERELAQCVMMLLTAAPEDFDEWKHNGAPRFFIPTSQWEVKVIISRITQHYVDTIVDYWQLLRTVGGISTIIDLPTELEKELNRMRNKHLPKPDDGPASQNEVANEHVIDTEAGITWGTQVGKGKKLTWAADHDNLVTWDGEKEKLFSLSDYKDGSGVD